MENNKTVDLHFHAGSERIDNTTLYDYINFAQDTGRKILGVTDHYGFYIPGNKKQSDLYTKNLDGHLTYFSDIEEISKCFPGIKIFKSTEFGPGALNTEIPEEVTKQSDYFLCEPPGQPGLIHDSSTKSKLEHLDSVAKLKDRISKPFILAHPFRFILQDRLNKRNQRKAKTRQSVVSS